jgi:tryptophan halogenase
MHRIVVVGGGTAGWMSAIAIGSRFPEKQVTVVDPKVISPIGVGESVTGIVQSLVTDPLNDLSLGEFFRRCDVTFKTGIWYKNWQREGTEYLTPIDVPAEFFRHHYDCHAEEFYAAVAANGAQLGEVQIFGHLMRAGRTDHYRNPDGSVNYLQSSVSVQFDALKFAAWLQEKAVTRPNIHHVDDVVDTFEQNPENGHITKIRTRGGQEIEGDLFLDCTGFHRLLLAKAYKPKWISYSDYIRVDSAIPCFVPHPEGQPIPNYTLATAMPHGWMWQIPTQSRLGKGYLFSSRYVDVEGALANMRAAGVNPGDNPRVLRFDTGRFEKVWQGNVCTIGLSGGFIEPLEASTIHSMVVQIRFLTELYLPFLNREVMPVIAEQYNELVRIAYEDYLDFINFHYLTGRDDTDFWREHQKPEAMTPANRMRLEKWKHTFPMREDFPAIYTQRTYHTTGIVVWATILAALGHMRQNHAQRVVQLSRNPQRLNENVHRYFEARKRLVPAALSHAEAIEFFRQLP